MFYPKLIITDKFGCKDSIQDPIPVIVKGPEAKFGMDSSSFCRGDFTINFSDSSVANGTTAITEWKWNFGDGHEEIATDPSNVSHSYNQTSTYKNYKPTLTVTDELGCSDSYKLEAFSYSPRASFYTNDTLRCGLFSIRFYNNSSARVSSSNQYKWVYGDGEIAYGYSGGHNHQYADTGKFTVKLIVTDDGGCVDSISRSNYVKLVKPVASFDVGGDTSKCVGTFSLPFVSTSAYSNSYHWDFGDDESSSTTNIEVSHFYSTAGSYNVRLIVTGLNGCKDTMTKPIRIKGPVGELLIDDDFLCVGEPLIAKVEGSNIKGYFWDFGDLSPTSELNNSDSVNHFYRRSGKYLPNLILISPEACQITLSALDSIVVDSISAGPDANIECGDTHTNLKGVSALGFDNNYFWEGPLGVNYLPGNQSLATAVDVVGEYVLKAQGGLCDMTDTVEVTTSGIVPNASAGVDVKLDCITGKASLVGVTTTADTSLKWTGPVGEVFIPSDVSSEIEVKTAGEYVLTVTQKYCTMTDTVEVIECSLNPTDTLFKICADVFGTPATFTTYDLTTFESHVIGGVTSNVTWFADKDFTTPVINPSAISLKDSTEYYAQIISLDGLEIGRAKADIIIHDYVDVDFSPIPATCELADTIQIENAFPLGGQFSGTGVTADGRFSPPATEGVYPIKYEFTSEEGCRDTLMRSATVIDMPDAPIVEDTVRYCQAALSLPSFQATAYAGNSLLWYTKDTVSLPSVPNLFRNVVIDSFYVTQKNTLCESKPSLIVVVVDTTPIAPQPFPINAVCEGFEDTLYVSGFENSTFSWSIDNGISVITQNSLEDSIHFTAGNSAMNGTVSETTLEGCTGESTAFTIPVDLHPTQALVSNALTDSIIYCITNEAKVMTGNSPSIGLGHWNILKNKDLALVEDDNPISPILDFTTMNDTLVAEWITENGVCPLTKATLTILPEQAFYPEVTLDDLLPICEQNTVVFNAHSGIAAGDAPTYLFYNNKDELLDDRGLMSTMDLFATNDTSIYVKMVSNYQCLYEDTAVSNTVFLDVIMNPFALIDATDSVICETNNSIVLSARDNKEETVYEWFFQEELLYQNTIPQTFELTLPQESGHYVLKTSNDYCPSNFDTLYVKIYEQVHTSFPSESIEITYTGRNTIELPLVIDPLDYDSVSSIVWDYDRFLGYYMKSPRFFNMYIGDTSIQNPHFLAQDENMENTYMVTAYVGPEGVGCESSSSILVNNYMPADVPNAFSPNNDGLNDTWIIHGLVKYPLTEVKIFNRWGNTLFEDHHGYQTPWDGTSNGSKVPVGTYYYVIDFLGSTDNSDFSDSGWLLIIE